MDPNHLAHTLPQRRNTLQHMRDTVFFEGAERHDKSSRFWMLLVLASIIATAGVVADSTATVIGAMIVAPLMTPILGMMLAVVLGDRRNLLRCVGLVVAGAATAVAIGFVIGLGLPHPVTAATNAQVAARIDPKIIDLIAAIATGAVGSIALVRSDISDTLPGVAIAISLVPPLSVVGLTLEAGEFHESAGALLLFATNVAAIIGTGVVVMAIYGIQRLATPPERESERALNRRRASAVIAISAVLIAIPLAASSVRITTDRTREQDVERIVDRWANRSDWEVVDVRTIDNHVVVRAEGPLPLPAVHDIDGRTASRRGQAIRGDGAPVAARHPDPLALEEPDDDRTRPSPHLLRLARRWTMAVDRRPTPRRLLGDDRATPSDAARDRRDPPSDPRGVGALGDFGVHGADPPEPSDGLRLRRFPRVHVPHPVPAPGAPEVAARTAELLESAGIPARSDAQRGFDHGVFAPLVVAWPEASVPIVQLSIRHSYDPEAHLAAGRAIAPLRDEGVLIVGSGFSYHNLRLMGPAGAKPSAEFDAWLRRRWSTSTPRNEPGCSTSGNRHRAPACATRRRTISSR